MGTATATYLITVQNDGNVADTFDLFASGLPSGWSAQYFDGATDVSSQVVSSGGWSTPTLAAGANRELKILVTPGANVAARAVQDILVSAISSNDATKRDAVKISTSAFAPPDLLIKKTSDSDATYAIDNVYQSTPSGAQVVAQSTPVGGKTSFSIKLQNDSSATRTFVLKAFETSAKPSAWSVV